MISLLINEIQNAFLYNVIKDFFFPLFLAFISGVFAYLIFFRQIIIDNKKDISTKEENLKNKLTYFAITILNCINNAEAQNSNLKNLIDELKKQEINSIPLSKSPTYDLKIIAKEINAENYLLSYLMFYSKESKLNTMNEFKNIFDSCCLIYDIFDQNYESIENKFELDNQLQVKFSDMVNECAILLGDCLEKMRKESNPLFPELLRIYQESLNLRKYSEREMISAQHYLLLSPLSELLTQWNHKGVVFDDNTGNLWVKSGKCIDLYDHLKSNNERFKELLNNNYEYTIELIQIIKDSSFKLRNDFLK